MYWNDDDLVKSADERAPRGGAMWLLIAIVGALALLLLILSIWY